MLNKKVILILAIVIVSWLILNSLIYRSSHLSRQINEDVVHIFDSVSNTSPLQFMITTFYLEKGQFPNNNQELGIGSPDTFNRRAVSKITVGPEGVIEISLKNIVSKNASIFLKPYLTYTGIGDDIEWQCFSYTVSQSHFDHTPLSQFCEYREDTHTPTLPQPPSWTIASTENLINAIHQKRRSMVSRMLEKGIDVNVEVNGELPLQAAIEENELTTTKVLISAGSDVNVRLAKYNDMSMLMFATSREKINPNIISLLLRKGADLTLQDTEGLTALMHAAKADNTYFINLLIKAGADINIEDNNGKTAADHALANNNVNKSSYRALMTKHHVDTEFIYVLPRND